MRVKKISFLISFFVTVFSLGVYLVPFPALFNQANDISLAIFGSSLLVCVISLVEYFDQRRLGIERFCEESNAMMQLMKRCRHYNAEFNPEFYAKDWLDVLSRGMYPLNSAFGNLDFLFANSTLKALAFDRVYKILLDRYRTVEQYSRPLSSNNPSIQKEALMKLNDAFYESFDYGEIRSFENSGKWADVMLAIGELIEAVYPSKKNDK